VPPGYHRRQLPQPGRRVPGQQQPLPDLPGPGACCKFDGSCIANLLPAACTSQGGTFQGAGSQCGNCPPTPPVVYTKCNISTGPTTLSGTAAPAGSTWSEVARDETDPFTANTVAGFTASGGYRVADDFVIPAGGLNVAYVHILAYTNGITTPSITAATVQIWNGTPPRAAR
jgi:hypothetical protein